MVTKAHALAVRAARAAGHRVLLCPGRPLAMLPAHILEAGFDGLVASAGAYVEVGGQLLMDRRFPDEMAARTLAALDAHDAVYFLETTGSLHVRREAEARLREIIEAHFSQRPDAPASGSSAILGSLTPIPALPSFAKISVFEEPVSVGSIAAEIGQDVAVVENSIADEGRHTGELFRRGVSKADGVAVAIGHLGIGRADIIAFGDGVNDLEIVAYAGGGGVAGLPSRVHIPGSWHWPIARHYHPAVTRSPLPLPSWDSL